MKRNLPLHTAALIAVTAVFAFAAPRFVYESGKTYDIKIPLATVSYPNGKTMPLTHGVGSAAFHSPKDPENIIYTLSDRGPNIDCNDTIKLTGLTMCESGKVFPVPSFSPSIYKFRLTGDKAELIERITLKGARGKEISGLSNPLTVTDTENAYSSSAKILKLDPSGLDTEGLVRMPDGTFWMADEYGPSVIHVDAKGKIITRYVPEGMEKDLAHADYDVKGSLPSILMKRKLNRGMESIAIDPDGKYLYAALQSPLANPDNNAYKSGRNVRLLKMSAKNGKVMGEYVYQMETPDVFFMDNMGKPQKQSDVKISEMAGVGADKLLVLERINQSTRFYLIDMSKADNILNQKYDNPETLPSLEQHATAKDAGIAPVTKKLVFNTDDHNGLMSKIEGIALLGKNRVALINDNDFGIDGSSTSLILINMPLGQ
ncbi:MAG: esterase-like activity of phytase family protein [Deferribacterales bacterium]